MQHSSNNKINIPQVENRVEWENTSHGEILKKLAPKKQNFKKSSKTFLGTLGGKLYLKLQLGSSLLTLGINGLTFQ